MEITSFDRLLMDVFREMGLHQPDEVLPGWSLSLSEIFALSVLAARVPLSQQDLGRELFLEKSSVSRLVQHLERRGWVVRERDLHDSRLRLLRLSPEGENMAKELQQHMHERHEQLFHQLSADEQTSLLRGLTALLRALRSISSYNAR